MAVKISRTSWHYRLVRFFHDGLRPIPDNLCGYFWSVVWSLIGVCFMIAISPFALCVLVVVGPGLLLYSWLKRREARLEEKRQNDRGELERPLLAEWFKAKKDRICPMIEWED